MAMKIGILGSGNVAQVLGAGFLKHGHAVTLGTRDPSKLAEWAARYPGAKVGSNADAARFGDVLVLAAKGTKAAESLRLAGLDNIAGKPVIDSTNPISDLPPANGVIQFFTGPGESLMEQLQREFPQAKLVKAFNSVGGVAMVNPPFKEKPTMFICGNDESAKKTVRVLLEQFGYEPADMGGVESARAIEPLCMLWCIPGFLNQDWSPRAFRLVR
jgi:8-hydroxy-5-deazaflavin:NADPH oxidoreductase